VRDTTDSILGLSRDPELARPSWNLRARAVFALKRRGSMFGRRKPAPLDAASRMGFRSKLVLAKLGYDAVLDQDLPEELALLAARLNPVAPMRRT
jgi:hypothetical protein